ncbi:TrkH family potassium uptake protein [Agromyces indicus]|uniref:Potassium transporter TrkG n=1 Tax=Agromyces indicus TaxID=758919 RepID=A0ABU1FGX3_9MICO|nr:potassium transporter TrkG [Agromyces indicus]MDR5691002.1 potassium transporter TrkG [Agromyces indicus]
MAAQPGRRRRPSQRPPGASQRRSWLAGVREAVDSLVRTSPARFAILIFAGLIGITTLLLSLPIARAGEVSATPLADALFTATSTICVTGLTTVDMATYWSPFGNAVIFIGMNIGGMGVLTMASILGLVVSRRLGLRARLIAASDTNAARAHAGPVSEQQAIRLGEVGGLLATVALSTLAIEFVIFVGMIPSVLAQGYDFGTSVWYSAYYSVSAFTNTGFNPNPQGPVEFFDDYWFQSLMMLAVFLGSLGFPVIFALLRTWRVPRRWSVHVKLTLTTTISLWIAGALAFLVLEYDNPKTYGAFGFGKTLYEAFFMSTMTRSGGFATIDMADLYGSSLLVTDMLMFVGGGSASTAGGIKVTTLAVLFLAAYAEARGAPAMEAFGRRIPRDMLRLAVSVVLWGATIVAVSTVIIVQITKAPLDFVLFDVISAFATCGLSTGLTESLPPEGKYVMAATMFMGRVGTVTLAAALAAAQRRQLFKRPEERPIVG